MLDTSHVVFPNGAITLVLILAESHLSIHTWPEENLIAIDLFSCGAIDGQAVLDQLTGALAADRGAPYGRSRGACRRPERRVAKVTFCSSKCCQ